MAAMQEKMSSGVVRKRSKRGKKKKNKIVQDNRFQKVHSDPRFARLPPQQNKVKVDERFSALFNDPSFQQTAKIDKWGRKVDVSQHNEEMDRLYELGGKDENLSLEGALHFHEGEVVEDSDISKMEEDTSHQGSPSSLSGKNSYSTEPQHHRKISTKRKRSEPSTEHKPHASVGDKNCTPDGPDSKNSEKDDEKDYMSPSEAQRKAQQVARMRGALEGSSSEESDSADDPLTDEDLDNAEVDVSAWGIGAWAGNPDETVAEGVATKRIAAVDLDWDNIRAVDILHIMRSFLPSTGKIEGVTVYISDYGLKRIAEEDKKGPGALGLFGKVQEKNEREGICRPVNGEKNQSSDEDEESNSSGDDNDVDVEQLRVYEKSKLRYYYATVECDSIESAAHLVQELDGKEFEKSHCIFDLRFIPDDMDFATCPSRDSATEVPDEYEPPSFECHAMTKTNLKLSWDNDDPYRKKQIRRKFKEEDLLKEDFKVYLASDSDKESGEEEDATNDIEMIREQYRSAFGKLEDGSSSQSDSMSDSDSSTNSKNVQELNTSDSPKLEEISDIDLRCGAETPTGDDSVADGNGRPDSDTSEHEVDDREQDGPPGSYLVHESENEISFQMPSRPVQSGNVMSQNLSKKKSNGLSESKSKAELDLLLLDDKTLHAARKGTGLLHKSEDSGGRKLTKRERIRLSKLRKDLKKHGSDEDDAEDKDFQIDLKDMRFERMFSSADYAIDPTHPAFKRSKGAEGLMKEVVKSKGGMRHLSADAKLHVAEIAQDHQQGSDLQAIVRKLKKKYPKSPGKKHRPQGLKSDTSKVREN